LEDFGEPVFIDDVVTVGLDRRAIYAMVDCHNGHMIPPPSILVHTGGIWGEVFVIVVEWASINGPPKLAEGYMYGRTEHDVFGMEDSATKSLMRGSQRLWDFYHNQARGETQTG
jgi:hypothetical protein